MNDRDEFAASALQALIADPNADFSKREAAAEAYGYADAMIARRAMTDGDDGEALRKVRDAAPQLLTAARLARDVLEAHAAHFGAPGSDEREAHAALGRAIQAADPGTDALRQISQMVARTAAARGELGE